MTATLAFALPSLDALDKALVFLLMLSVLIVLHEGGHFALARINGVRVNDFAVGFGPTLLKWTSPRSGTNYRLNVLPIGGYCAMQGEDGKTNEAEQQRQFREQGAAVAAAGSGANAYAASAYAPYASYGATAVYVGASAPALALPVEPEPVELAADNFQAKAAWRRLSIVVAGPFSNFVLALVIYVLAAVAFGVASPTHFSTEIGPIADGTPAQKAGLEVGDRIVSLDGRPVTSGDTMVGTIRDAAGKPLRIGLVRHGVPLTVTAVPAPFKDGGKTIGRLGFSRIPVFERVGLVAAIPLAWSDFTYQMTSQFGGIVALFSHPKSHLANVSGVIGMGRAAAVYQDIGWAAYLDLAATISIALGMLNLLPIPALDGGRAVFIVAEMLRGKPVDPEKEALVHVAGMAVLMVLMVAVAYHDIANIFNNKGVF